MTPHIKNNTDRVIRYLEENQRRFVDELIQWLKIPSISTDLSHVEDMQRSADWLMSHLNDIGVTEVKQYKTGSSAKPGHPLVLARCACTTDVKSRNIARLPRVLVYGHHDVQPSVPNNLWDSPPFDPTQRGTALFARGAADDKGQVFMYLKVIEAFYRTGTPLPVEIKLMIEGEEEIGSPNLLPFLKEHRSKLASDLVMVSDTHMISRSTPSITVGLRGMMCFQIDVETAKGDLHSGTCGGVVPNPIQVLADILSRCKDSKTGRIKVPGFYENLHRYRGKQKEMLQAAPPSPSAFKKSVGAHHLFGEQGRSMREQMGTRPTFDVNGIWGGFAGEGMKTVLPARAHAKVSMRLVPDQNPRILERAFRRYIKDISPPYAKVKITTLQEHADPISFNADGPIFDLAANAVRKTFGKRPLFLPEGGSVPIVSDLKKMLKCDVLLLGFGLPDDNLHAPNEKFDLDMMKKGMLTIARFFSLMGQSQ